MGDDVLDRLRAPGGAAWRREAGAVEGHGGGVEGPTSFDKRLAHAHNDGGERVFDLPVCGPARVADAAVAEGCAGRSPARLNAEPQPLPDALRGFRALLFGNHAFDGRQQVAVAVELHERAL